MKNECREKTALETMSEFMEYCEYAIKTKDGICLKCRLYRARYTITPDANKWSWEVYWQISESKWNCAWESKMLYSVPEYHTLEYCINRMNEYIKDNFKTRLD